MRLSKRINKNVSTACDELLANFDQHFVPQGSDGASLNAAYNNPDHLLESNILFSDAASSVDESSLHHVSVTSEIYCVTVSPQIPIRIRAG